MSMNFLVDRTISEQSNRLTLQGNGFCVAIAFSPLTGDHPVMVRDDSIHQAEEETNDMLGHERRIAMPIHKRDVPVLSLGSKPLHEVLYTRSRENEQAKIRRGVE
jgi:hypothetical protein